jgi:hypothetical protein
MPVETIYMRGFCKQYQQELRTNAKGFTKAEENSFPFPDAAHFSSQFHLAFVHLRNCDLPHDIDLLFPCPTKSIINEFASLNVYIK